MAPACQIPTRRDSCLASSCRHVSFYLLYGASEVTSFFFFFFFLVNWKFIATLCGTSQGTPFFQQYLLRHTAFALCLILVILAVFQAFSLLLYLLRDLWSGIFDVTVVKRLWLVDRSGDSISNHVFFTVIIYFWVHWVFVAAGGLSLVARSGDCSSLRCTGSVLQLSGPGPWASGAVALGLSCSGMCGIFPDKGSNLCPLHWQDS